MAGGGGNDGAVNGGLRAGAAAGAGAGPGPGAAPAAAVKQEPGVTSPAVTPEPGMKRQKTGPG